MKQEYKFNNKDLSHKTIALLLMASLRQDETGFERLAACLSMGEIEYVCNGKEQPVNGIRLIDEDSLIAQVGPIYEMKISVNNDVSNQTFTISGFKSEEEYNEIKSKEKTYYPNPTIKHEIPVGLAEDYGFETF